MITKIHMVTLKENYAIITDEGVDISVAKKDFILVNDGSDIVQVLGRTGGKITTVSVEDANTLKQAL